ncbi:MAG: hypothetical protein WBL20_19435 [Sphingobium sp.]
MRPDQLHAQHCRCGQCAQPMTRADKLACAVCVFLLPIVCLAIDPIVDAIRSLLP